jgi:anti-sigma B factor antagonist
VFHDVPAGTFAGLVRKGSARTVVELSGELDISVAPDLRACLGGALEGPLPAEVHVDLSSVTFLDSASVSELVSACKRARQAGRDFSVACGAGLPQKVLAIQGLTDYLGVVDETKPADGPDDRT